MNGTECAGSSFCVSEITVSSEGGRKHLCEWNKRLSGCQTRQTSFPESPADRTPEAGGFGCYVKCLSLPCAAEPCFHQILSLVIGLNRVWTKCAWANLTATSRVVAMRLLGGLGPSVLWSSVSWTYFSRDELLSEDEISDFTG